MGEISGEGLVTPFKNLIIFPEAHTDFIMAIIGEEFGFIGILLLSFF